MTRFTSQPQNRSKTRRGSVLIYIVLCYTVMMGFCAMSVDLARTQVAKTELRRLADAAARAGAASLNAGTTATQNAAMAVVASNLVDGAAMTINAADVQIGNWSGTTFTQNGSPTNAVRVYTRRTTANGNPLPLLFSKVLGKPTIDVWAFATAAVVTSNSESDTVSAHGNPWLAGEPTGTLGSQPDPGYPSANHQWAYDIAGPVGGTAPSGEPYCSPMQVGFTVVPGDVITVSSVSGSAKNAPNGASYDATGNSGGTIHIYNDDQSFGVSEHGIADVYTPINSVVGEFLSNNQPDSQTVPPVLDFTNQSTRDYTTIEPLKQQPFYVGDGQTSAGVQQTIVVPAGATRFFIGTMDGHEWSNNVGGYNVTVTQMKIELVQ